MAASCHAYTLFELWFLDAQQVNPGHRLRKPSLAQRRFASVVLDAILVEQRTEPRWKRRPCAARPPWKSLAYVRGGHKILKLT